MARARPTDLLVFSRDALRRLDDACAREYAIPTLLLMENAGRLAAETALDGLGDEDSPAALVVCGPGNNGGDGLVAARHLHNAGVRVEILAPLGDAFRGDAGVQREIVGRMGLAPRADADAERAWRDLRASGVVIDALFGTGLTRAADGAARDAIGSINALATRGVPVLSVDCPSGMDADTGRVLGEAVRASVTLSLVGLKEGFLTLDAQSLLGEVVVGDIGAPRELVERLGRRVPAPAIAETKSGARRAPAARGKARAESE
ncbi:MAG: NAD(P)H-hydrate epimerase [Planctomycetota bacterium]|nr:NAD(P)H-hydrate epimerase [Planctomycetota bacterium]